MKNFSLFAMTALAFSATFIQSSSIPLQARSSVQLSNGHHTILLTVADKDIGAATEQAFTNFLTVKNKLAEHRILCTLRHEPLSEADSSKMPAHSYRAFVFSIPQLKLRVHVSHRGIEDSRRPENLEWVTNPMAFATGCVTKVLNSAAFPKK